MIKTWGTAIGLAAAIGLLGSHDSRSETVPTAGAVDARVRFADYDPTEVYKLRGFLGYQIDLQFEEGESFTGLGAGDLEGLAFVGKDNHLFLKPKALKVATNITVLTNRRHYQIDYATVARTMAGEDEVVYALRFVYPKSDSAGAQRAREEETRAIDARLSEASAARHQNIDYWFCGDAGLKPTAASDDGVHTRLTFAANAELPAVFVRNDDESESLLNFSMDEGDVIVHRVARRFILRRGRLSGCVVNKAYEGVGLRLESGTVTHAVKRDVRGGAK